MYLPLTGFDAKKKFYSVSIDPIGPSAATYSPQPTKAGVGVQSEAQKIGHSKARGIDSSKQNGVDTTPLGAYIPVKDSMNTQDFLVLKSENHKHKYAALDIAIEKMKENVEQVGEAIEAMAKMTKETSKGSVGLQVLKATFDAIDRMRESFSPSK